MSDNIREEIRKIKERNARVEIGKAWETSRTRRIIIAMFIYIFSIVIFISINVQNPFVNGLIPTTGFLLSMATFPFFKAWWIKTFYNQR